MGIVTKAASAASWWLFITLASAQNNGSQAQGKPGFEYVDPLIGTVNGGVYGSWETLNKTN